MPETYIERILRARVYDVAIESPLTRAERLSRRLGNQVFLKREDLQPVFSFKLRGAYNKLHPPGRGDPQARGDHRLRRQPCPGGGPGGRRLGIEATIVMPRTTPAIKVQAVRALGGKAVLHGDSYDEAYAHALELAAERGLAFIHPFDDPDVIAGQGTIGMEILRQHPEPAPCHLRPGGRRGPDRRRRRLREVLSGPRCGSSGSSPRRPRPWSAALAAGERVVLDQVGLFADGVAVRQIGEETFRVARQRVDEVVLVEHRRDLRRHQGHLRRHPRHRRAGRGPGAWPGSSATWSARGSRGRSGRHRERGQHQLRPPAPRRRAGRAGRAARGPAGGPDPRAPGELPEPSAGPWASARSPSSTTATPTPASAQVFVGVELARGDEERRELIARLRRRASPWSI